MQAFDCCCLVTDYTLGQKLAVLIITLSKSFICFFVFLGIVQCLTNKFYRFFKLFALLFKWLEKTADISRRHHRFPLEMTSEKRAQKFHTDDASPADLGSASDWLKIGFLRIMHLKHRFSKEFVFEWTEEKGFGIR